MRNTIITAGAFAAAIALNSGVALGADTSNRSRSASAAEGGQTIVGHLLSLRDYLGIDVHTAGFNSTTTNSSGTHSTLTNSSSSHIPQESNAKQLGSQTDKLGGFSGARNESTTSGNRDQRFSKEVYLTNSSNAGLQANRPDSSNDQTLVLIAHPGATRSVQSSPGGRISPTSDRPAEVQFVSEQRNVPGTRPTTAGGAAYILVFGDDASGQSAYLKAKGLVTDGGSNWETTGGATDDRVSSRRQDDGRSGVSQDATHSQQPADRSVIGRTSPRESSGTWSKTGSQVRVMGMIVDRGGIQAIRVSEISQDGLPSDRTGKGPGTSYPNRPIVNEGDDKKND